MFGLSKKEKLVRGWEKQIEEENKTIVQGRHFSDTSIRLDVLTSTTPYMVNLQNGMWN